jgi:hypothetical protein
MMETSTQAVKSMLEAIITILIMLGMVLLDLGLILSHSRRFR